MKVLDFPLARITIAFVLGLLVVHFLKPTQTAIVFITLCAALLFFSGTYFLTLKKVIPQYVFGLSVYLLSFLIGVTTQIVHTDSFQKNNYTHYQSAFEKSHLITLTLREKLRNNDYNDRYVATLGTIDTTKCQGKIILNIQKDSSNSELKIGSSLRFRGTLIRNSVAKNPNQFDYAQYLENKQIYAQAYVSQDELSVGTSLRKDIWYYSSALRNTILRNLKKNNFQKDDLNVAIALIMGQQQEISTEIIRDYQYAGAVHILSVSGLHIGFILLFTTFILKPIPNTKRNSIIKLGTILMTLFLFGIIAGLAPSVIRSVTMFSFVAIGNHLRRSVNIYHTLLVSILLILLFEPNFLFDVGFQLSYIAVFFIVWFQPLLASIWSPQSKVAHYIWDILTVSFAAQIGTLPLSLYYFHQFPGLFFATNLLIIPALSCIMVLGVIVMALAAFNCVPYFLSKTLEWSIHYLNKTISWIASFEEFIIQDLSFNMYFLTSFYLLLLTIIIWFKSPSYKKLLLVFIGILLVQLSFIKTKWDTQNQQEWIVFNSKKQTLITERKGQEVTLYGNDSILRTSQKNKLLTSYLVGNFGKLKHTEKIKNVYFFHGNKILVLDSSNVCPSNQPLDVLVLTQSPKINLDRLFQNLRPKIVVADATNYKTLLKYWKASCSKQKIPFHATGEKGFYRLY